MPSERDFAIGHCVRDGENVLWTIVGLENAKEGKGVGIRGCELVYDFQRMIGPIPTEPVSALAVHFPH
jgi:hypothetical protein